MTGNGKGESLMDLVLLREHFSRRPEVIVAYLFGSQAGRRANAMSDLDLAILVDEGHAHDDRYGYRSSRLSELMSILKTDKLDLVLLHQAPPLLRHRVIKAGTVVFCRDERKRVQFEVNAIRRYADTEPLRRVQERYLCARLEKGLFGRTGGTSMIDIEVIQRHLGEIERAVAVLRGLQRYTSPFTTSSISGVISWQLREGIAAKAIRR